MARWLGIDFGSKYIGVAVGDESISVPLKTLDAKPEEALLKELAKLAREEPATGFVVGLPIHMNGSEGKAAKACRDFAKRLAEASKLPVEFADERLSSWDAEGMLIEAGLKPSERKQRVHALAAKLILEAFFNARKAPNEAGSGDDGE
jgi:putative Holliday junction resolvase